MIETPGFDLLAAFQALYDALVFLSDRFLGVDLTTSLLGLWVKIAFVSTVITPILLFGIAYVFLRYKQLRIEEMAAYRAKAKPSGTDAQAPKNEQWKRVEELIASERPNDWRVAILEADVMLDDLMTSMGYVGDNLGEKLKTVDKSDLLSIRSAWDAHMVRNEVAHGGGDFILTQREARRVIGLYREVFNEANYI